MKLWDCQMAANPRRARIFMTEKGLAIPTQEVNILAGEYLSPEYLRINPWGLLPALELDDGTVITEAPCIFRYLEPCIRNRICSVTMRSRPPASAHGSASANTTALVRSASFSATNLSRWRAARCPATRV